MTAKELQKRNEKSQHLRVIQVDDEQLLRRVLGREDLLPGDL